jgi:hypothetical protein
VADEWVGERVPEPACSLEQIRPIRPSTQLF